MSLGSGLFNYQSQKFYNKSSKELTLSETFGLTSCIFADRLTYLR
jgi:hypothetical protein